LFKGMSYPMLSAGVLNSIFFGAYGLGMSVIKKAKSVDSPNYQPTYGDMFFAGCTAGTAQIWIACPVDLVKIKLQTQTAAAAAAAPGAGNVPHYRGPFDVVRKLIQQEGIRGCYRGLSAMAARDIHTFGIYIVVYEYLTRKMDNYDVPKAPKAIIAGGLAGVVMWAGVIHIDVVKSRIQSDNPLNPKYRGMIDCFRQCYAEGGLRIFFRGFTVCCLRAFPSNGATFLGYEYCMSLCKRLDGSGDSLL